MRADANELTSERHKATATKDFIAKCFELANDELKLEAEAGKVWQ
jgi:hypothetical protein